MKKYLLASALLIGAGIMGMAATSVVFSFDFIPDVLCRTGVVNRQTANTLGGIYARLGNPLDRLNPIQNGGFIPAIPIPSLAMGNRCVAQVGAFPGPSNPVGSI